MRAVTQFAVGDPSVLQIIEVEVPRPVHGQVLIKTGAIGVNPVDAQIRAGEFALIGEPPFTLGWDVAGTVDAVGPGVTGFHPGDQVMGMLAMPGAGNTYAEYVTASADEIVRKPAELAVEQAAGLPLAGLTAWQALIGIADVQPGQRVLIHRAAGGVGHLAVQIAKSRGAFVVGTASAGKHALLRELGVDFPLDYRSVDFADVGSFDVVLDTVGGLYAERSAVALRPSGLLVSTVAQNPGITAARAAELGIGFQLVIVHPSAADLVRLCELVDAGKLRVHVDRVLPLADAATAQEHIETGTATGKIILVP